jgi:hypothetical protein
VGAPRPRPSRCGCGCARPSWRPSASVEIAQRCAVNDAPCPPLTRHGASIMLQDVVAQLQDVVARPSCRMSYAAIFNDALCPPFTTHGASIMLQDVVARLERAPPPVDLWRCHDETNGRG